VFNLTIIIRFLLIIAFAVQLFAEDGTSFYQKALENKVSPCFAFSKCCCDSMSLLTSCSISIICSEAVLAFSLILFRICSKKLPLVGRVFTVVAPF
jgi:hypothetical protein